MEDEPTLWTSIQNLGAAGCALIATAFIAMGICACSNDPGAVTGQPLPAGVDTHQQIIDQLPTGTIPPAGLID